MRIGEVISGGDLCLVAISYLFLENYVVISANVFRFVSVTGGYAMLL